MDNMCAVRLSIMNNLQTNTCLRTKYEFMVEMCKVQKYKDLPAIEFKIAGKSFPIIHEDEEKMRYQICEIQAWIYEHPGTNVSAYTNIYNMRCNPHKTKEIIVKGLRELPNDTGAINAFIDGVDVLNDNALLRIIATLVCHAILVDDTRSEVAEERAKKEYKTIINALFSIMNQINYGKCTALPGRLYEDLINLFEIIKWICCFKADIDTHEFDVHTRAEYFHAILKRQMKSKQQRIDLRTFKKLMDLYYIETYGIKAGFEYVKNMMTVEHPHLLKLSAYEAYYLHLSHICDIYDEIAEKVHCKV